MKIAFWYIGKSTPPFVMDGISTYEKRLQHYTNYESYCFPHVKHANKLPASELKKKEANMVLSKMEKSDYLVILDEKGKDYKSVEFSKKLEQWITHQSGRIIFLIGGAFGVDEQLIQRSNQKLALGKATYSHQIIRIMFLEQLYRAFTIIRGEKYHNE